MSEPITKNGFFVALHILKVAAGVSSLEHLNQVVDHYSYTDAELGHIMHMSSRNTPKRMDEVLDGGSVFWIIKRAIVARAELVAIRQIVREDGKKGCQMCIRPHVIPTIPQPKRGFQGWRYLKPEDAPKDLTQAAGDPGKGSPELAMELKDLGLL